MIAPDVGGGFGNKLQVPPEVVALCLMAFKTRRPVKWIETRRESLMAFLHAREQTHDVEIPMKRDGTILGIKSHEIVNGGGYLDARISGPSLGAGMWLPGPYMVKGFHVDIDVVLTNKCPYGAYRGFGSQMGALVIERSVDIIARQLGRDPVDLRKQNVIKETPYKCVTGHEFDSGDYMAGLEKALEMVDYPALREEQARLRKEGRYMGIGVAMAVEGAGWNTYTAAMAQHYVPTLDYATVTMRMDTSGNIKVLIGDVACGTSHATTAAQVAAGRYRGFHRHHRGRGRGHRGDALRFRHPRGPLQRRGAASGGGIGHGAQEEGVPGGRPSPGGSRGGHGNRRGPGAGAWGARQEPAGEPGGAGGLLGGGDPAP